MGREKPSAIWIERNYHVILTSKKTCKIADVSRFLKSSIRGLILRSIKSANIRHPVPSAKMPEFLRGTQLLRSEAWESVIPLDTLKSESCHVANRGSSSLWIRSPWSRPTILWITRRIWTLLLWRNIRSWGCRLVSPCTWPFLLTFDSETLVHIPPAVSVAKKPSQTSSREVCSGDAQTLLWKRQSASLLLYVSIKAWARPMVTYDTHNGLFECLSILTCGTQTTTDSTHPRAFWHGRPQ